MLIYRLQFSDVSQRKKKKTLQIIKNISKSTLEETISFLNKDDLPTMIIFFSNKDVHREIISKVQECRQNKYRQGNPCRVFNGSKFIYS